MGPRRNSSTLCCWLEEAMSRILRLFCFTVRSSTAAVSGLEVVVEGVGQAVPAPSSASRLMGVFWSVFLPCSSAQRLWKETSPSASLPTSFFVLAMVFCSSWLCFSWWLCLHPISVLFVHQTEETLTQEGVPKQTVTLRGAPAGSSLETAPKVDYTHHSVLKKPYRSTRA